MSQNISYGENIFQESKWYATDIERDVVVDTGRNGDIISILIFRDERCLFHSGEQNCSSVKFLYTIQCMVVFYVMKEQI